jgi:hypothetical protein
VGGLGPGDGAGGRGIHQLLMMSLTVMPAGIMGRTCSW